MRGDFACTGCTDTMSHCYETMGRYFKHLTQGVAALTAAMSCTATDAHMQQSFATAA